MVENSLLTYFLSDPTLLSLLGGQKVYYHRVPSNIKMPWLTISVSYGGVRERLTQRKYTHCDTMFSIESEADGIVKSRNIAERALRLIENYRGDLGDIEDIYTKCTPIRSMDGYGGTFRSIFNVFIRHKELTTYPVTV